MKLPMIVLCSFLLTACGETPVAPSLPVCHTVITFPFAVSECSPTRGWCKLVDPGPPVEVQECH